MTNTGEARAGSRELSPGPGPETNKKLGHEALEASSPHASPTEAPNPTDIEGTEGAGAETVTKRFDLSPAERPGDAEVMARADELEGIFDASGFGDILGHVKAQARRSERFSLADRVEEPAESLTPEEWVLSLGENCQLHTIAEENFVGELTKIVAIDCGVRAMPEKYWGHFPALVAVSYDKGAYVSKQSGYPVGEMSGALDQISDEALTKLVQALAEAHQHGIAVEATPENLYYDVNGFSVAKCHPLENSKMTLSKALEQSVKLFGLDPADEDNQATAASDEGNQAAAPVPGETNQAAADLDQNNQTTLASGEGSQDKLTKLGERYKNIVEKIVNQTPQDIAEEAKKVAADEAAAEEPVLAVAS